MQRQNVIIHKISNMRIQNIQTINHHKIYFRGVFATYVKNIDKKHSAVNVTDFVDGFQSNVDLITDTYEKDREKAEKNGLERKKP